MAYDIRLADAMPRRLAVARGAASRATLSATIRQLLDAVWAVLRAQQVPTGHNVVVYLGGLEHLEAGVEVFGDVVERGDVRRSQTPAGQVVTTVHWGAYSELGGAYAALQDWCAVNGRRPDGTSWEVYGDWATDPRQLRTDIYLRLVSDG